MNMLLKVTIAILVFLYPIAIYFGLQYLEPKYLAVLLATLVIIRTFFTSNKLLKAIKGLWIIILLAGLTLATLSFIQNSELGLKLYPVVITSSFLMLFGYSLFKPPSMIERLARIQEPDLPEEGVIYTRKVTQLWCAFFIFNILVSLYTVFYTSTETWAVYNGLISYILMGSLFIGELVYRKWLLKSK